MQIRAFGKQLDLFKVIREQLDQVGHSLELGWVTSVAGTSVDGKGKMHSPAPVAVPSSAIVMVMFSDE